MASGEGDLPATKGDAAGGGCLIAVAATILLFALALPLGYRMAESTDVGLLVGAVVISVALALVLAKVGFSMLRR